jgi:LppX_LprAFG lipoprotein
MSRRLAATAAVGTTLVLSLTACLGGAGGKSADSGTGGVRLTASEVLQKTSQKSAQIHSFAADVTLNGSSQATTGSTHLTARVRLQPDVALTGTVDKLSVGGFTLTSSIPVVYLHSTLYGKVPQQFESFAGGKQWIKIDLSQAGKRAGVSLDSVVQHAELVDPAQQTKTFTAAKDARKVGEETIDGVTTTHYTGTITVKDALDTLDAQTRANLQRVYTQVGAQKINFDVWVDGQDQARKLTVKLNTSAGENTTLSIVYSDFGKAVSVSAPPADQVGDATAFKGMLGGH